MNSFRRWVHFILYVYILFGIVPISWLNNLWKMNTTFILNSCDFLTTFSLLTQKFEYDKVHHQRVKKYYLNGRAGFLSRKIQINLTSVFNNIKIMNLRRLIIIVVVSNAEDVLPYTTIERDGVLLQVQYVTFDNLIMRLDGNKNPDEFISEFANKLLAVEAAYTLYVFKWVTWGCLAANLANLNITLTGGLSNKRHLDSPLSIRHHSYLLALFNFDSWALQHCIWYDNIDKEIALPRLDFKGIQTGVKYLKNGSVNIEPRGDLAVQKNSVANDDGCEAATMKGDNSPALAFTIIDSEENRLRGEDTDANITNLAEGDNSGLPASLRLRRDGNNQNTEATSSPINNRLVSSTNNNFSVSALASARSKRGYHRWVTYQEGKRFFSTSLFSSYSIKSSFKRIILEQQNNPLDLNNPSEFEIYKQFMNDKTKRNDISKLSIDVSQNTVKDGYFSVAKQHFDISSKYPYSPTYIARKFTGKKSENPKHKITGLNTKIGINVWYELNFSVINREYLQPNSLFRDEFLRFKNHLKEIEHYYYHELNHFKNNDFIRSKNYYSYLINTPNSSIKNCIERLIWSYYNSAELSYWSPACINNPITLKRGYGIISLYHQIGVDLVEYMFDISYSKYLDEMGIRYYRSQKGKPVLTSRKAFLSYVDYKNNTIKNKYYDLDTKSLVEYGRDMYLFFIFRTWISLTRTLKSVENFSNKQICATNSKGVMVIQNTYNYENDTLIRGKFFTENFIVSRVGSYPYNKKNKVEEKENEKVISNSKNILQSVRVLNIKFIDQYKKIIRKYTYHVFDDTKKSPTYSKLYPRIDRRMKIGVKWIWTDPNALQQSNNKNRFYHTSIVTRSSVFQSKKKDTEEASSYDGGYAVVKKIIDGGSLLSDKNDITGEVGDANVLEKSSYYSYLKYLKNILNVSSSFLIYLCGAR